jgi:hypothetical protein
MTVVHIRSSNVKRDTQEEYHMMTRKKMGIGSCKPKMPKIVGRPLEARKKLGRVPFLGHAYTMFCDFSFL